MTTAIVVGCVFGAVCGIIFVMTFRKKKKPWLQFTFWPVALWPDEWANERNTISMILSGEATKGRFTDDEYRQVCALCNKATQRLRYQVAEDYLDNEKEQA